MKSDTKIQNESPRAKFNSDKIEYKNGQGKISNNLKIALPKLDRILGFKLPKTDRPGKNEKINIQDLISLLNKNDDMKNNSPIKLRSSTLPINKKGETLNISDLSNKKISCLGHSSPKSFKKIGGNFKRIDLKLSLKQRRNQRCRKIYPDSNSKKDISFQKPPKSKRKYSQNSKNFNQRFSFFPSESDSKIENKPINLKILRKMKESINNSADSSHKNLTAKFGGNQSQINYSQRGVIGDINDQNSKNNISNIMNNTESQNPKNYNDISLNSKSSKREQWFNKSFQVRGNDDNSAKKQIKMKSRLNNSVYIKSKSRKSQFLKFKGHQIDQINLLDGLMNKSFTKRVKANKPKNLSNQQINAGIIIARLKEKTKNNRQMVQIQRAQTSNINLFDNLNFISSNINTGRTRGKIGYKFERSYSQSSNSSSNTSSSSQGTSLTSSDGSSHPQNSGLPYQPFIGLQASMKVDKADLSISKTLKLYNKQRKSYQYGSNPQDSRFNKIGILQKGPSLSKLKVKKMRQLTEELYRNQTKSSNLKRQNSSYRILLNKIDTPKQFNFSKRAKLYDNDKQLKPFDFTSTVLGTIDQNNSPFKKQIGS